MPEVFSDARTRRNSALAVPCTLQLVDLRFSGRDLAVRGFVVAALAIKFGKIQAQLDGIELPFGHAARGHGRDGGVVFGDGVGLAILFLRQQRANGMQTIVIGIDGRGASQIFARLVNVAKPQLRLRRH